MGEVGAGRLRCHSVGHQCPRLVHAVCSECTDTVGSQARRRRSRNNAASTARGICVSAFSNRQHRSRSRTKKRVRSFQLPPGATMLRHLQRSLRAIHYSPIIGRDAACNPIPLHRFWDSHIELLSLEDSREAVYGTLDAWVAFEQDFPLASLKQALSVLEKEEQWHRIVQVIKWMLSKGQGNTMRTYELLACALEKDNRAEEAHRIWQNKVGHDLHSVPWRFCRLMLAIYYRNNRLDRLVKLFKELEACGRKPPSKDIVRKVEDAYETLGLLEDKKVLLDKYKDLYNKPSRDDRKKGSKSKKIESDKPSALLFCSQMVTVRKARWKHLRTLKTAVSLWMQNQMPLLRLITEPPTSP
ncbi:hypothetical protein ZEAMMB73_Zm00001d023300 [Zea mays]|uniref:Pentatricopeptide repeat-containing protein n=1 Tax=Zea mays TaxID=4577 RepID=A0A1D6IRI9_MAIZE|nr:hypothetical protein ZEAMMB73_Zm00001d023300 [Zea mays]